MSDEESQFVLEGLTLERVGGAVHIYGVRDCAETSFSRNMIRHSPKGSVIAFVHEARGFREGELDAPIVVHLTADGVERGADVP